MDGNLSELHRDVLSNAAIVYILQGVVRLALAILEQVMEFKKSQKKDDVTEIEVATLPAKTKSNKLQDRQSSKIADSSKDKARQDTAKNEESNIS